MTAKTKPNLKAQAQLKARLQREAGMRLSEEIRQKAELKRLEQIEDELRPKLNLMCWHGRLGRILFGSLYLLISIIFNFLLGLFFYFQDQDFMFDEYEMMRWELFTPLIIVMILMIYYLIVLSILNYLCYFFSLSLVEINIKIVLEVGLKIGKMQNS